MGGVWKRALTGTAQARLRSWDTPIVPRRRSGICRGLMLTGGRRSVEPMAARVHPQDVPSAHQSMHHLVSTSDWSDEAMLVAVVAQILPALARSEDGPCYWIVDDTGFPKKGTHSVGVARQYCHQTGKSDNCRVAVSRSFAAARVACRWRTRFICLENGR